MVFSIICRTFEINLQKMNKNFFSNFYWPQNFSKSPVTPKCFLNNWKLCLANYVEKKHLFKLSPSHWDRCIHILLWVCQKQTISACRWITQSSEVALWEYFTTTHSSNPLAVKHCSHVIRLVLMLYISYLYIIRLCLMSFLL